jgi:hypothetical protein
MRLRSWSEKWGVEAWTSWRMSSTLMSSAWVGLFEGFWDSLIA